MHLFSKDWLKKELNFQRLFCLSYILCLNFRVTDGDFIVTSEKLTININDLNDNKPEITPVADINIPENTQISMCTMTLLLK